MSASETRAAFLALAASRVCNDGAPCLRDDCMHCASLNELIDRRGEECDARGCTLNRCVFDPVS